MELASFDFIRKLVADVSAIELSADKQYLVEIRLLPVARRADLDSVDALVKQLRVAPNGPLRQQVVDAMTTNETSFFRDGVPFEKLRTVILPELLNRRGAAKRLNIWSAACASGQEPYSIAMLQREYFYPQLHDWKVRLLGTDLSTEALAKARSGCFTKFEITRGLPTPLVQKYFLKVDDLWQINDAIRGMVEFRQLNLSHDWPPLPRMDLILLRNVLVYFDAKTRHEILHRAYRLLRPDGYLVLGGAESLLSLDTEFKVTRGDGFSYFQPASS